MDHHTLYKTYEHRYIHRFISFVACSNLFVCGRALSGSAVHLQRNGYVYYLIQKYESFLTLLNVHG